MKKVGILTLLHNNYNFGGVLQAYALCQYLNNHNFKASVIMYTGNNNIVYKMKKDKLAQYNAYDIIQKGIEEFECKLGEKKITPILENRKQNILDFVDSLIPHTELYDDSSLIDIDKKFDFFISGSDQVWNPNCAFLPFLQGFTDQNHKKISYAASISRSILSAHEKQMMLPYLQQFKAISVREETAHLLLNSCGIKNVETVIDPTLLIKKEEWKNKIKKSYKTNKYILCYFFSDSREYRKKVMSMCTKFGYELIYIPYAKQKFNKGDARGSGNAITDIGPLELLSLIYNAEMVLTDSFHGVAFSINFYKNFFVFERDSRNVATSRNSRIYDILNLFELQKRLITIDDFTEAVFDEKIDYENVKLKLEEERKKAWEFLQKALQ